MRIQAPVFGVFLSCEHCTGVININADSVVYCEGCELPTCEECAIGEACPACVEDGNNE